MQLHLSIGKKNKNQDTSKRKNDKNYYKLFLISVRWAIKNYQFNHDGLTTISLILMD